MKITESLSYSKEQGLTFKAPKTKNSIRVILLSPSLIEFLKRLQDEQNLIKKRMGTAYHDYDLIICTIDGKPIFPRNLARTFYNIIEKANVKRMPLHGLRHTNATLLMKKGINPKIVSQRLGHARITTTLEIYTHTDLNSLVESVNTLENMFS